MTLVTSILLAGLLTVALSYAVEAVRRRPTAPAHLAWWPAASIESVDVDG